MRPQSPTACHSAYIYLFLLLATLAAYAQVFQFDFVNYDDPHYLPDNAHVRAGLTPDGVRWAFTSADDANGRPLTRLSPLPADQLVLRLRVFPPLPTVLL